MSCRDCADLEPTGCLCLVEDSTSFTYDGDGSENDPFTFSPVLNPSANQLLTCGVAGLMATLPTTISNPPACFAYRTSNTSIANNTLTAISLNVESYDTNTMHSGSVNPSRITFTTAGYYTVTWNCTWDKNAVGNRLAYIRKNGTTQLGYVSVLHGGADLYVGHSIVVQAQFSAADYVEGMVQQTSGVALQILAGAGSPVLTASLDA